MTKTNEYQCDIWGAKGWRTVTAQYALTRKGTLLRCVECHGAVRIHSEGPNGIPRAHAEHRQGHPGCSLGHYFDGTRTPHPFPVLAPGEVTVYPVAPPITTEDDESSFPEGRVRYCWHRHLERDGALAKRVKSKRLRDTGKLECDVCSFDFAAIYGETGEGFIEAHHRTPVSSLDGTQATREKDLALVCSNCHRMLHRAYPPITVEQLRACFRKR